MSIELQTALIAAGVSGITAILSWLKFQYDRTKWLIELKSGYAQELHRTGLAEYPNLTTILARLSSQADSSLSPESARDVARAINGWFYGVGGLCLHKSTRGAILGLRDACYHWQGGGTMRDEIKEWRNVVMFYLRRDIDLIGLESFNPQDTKSLLANLKEEIRQLTQNGPNQALQPTPSRRTIPIFR